MAKKGYKEMNPENSSASEPAVPYGSIDTLKVQLLNRIMLMNEPNELRSVLDFVKKQSPSSDNFEEEWGQSLSLDEFRAACKNKLKEIYGGH